MSLKGEKRKENHKVLNAILNVILITDISQKNVIDEKKNQNKEEKKEEEINKKKKVIIIIIQVVENQL